MIGGALRHITSMLTSRLVKNFRAKTSIKEANILHKMLETNQNIGNYEHTDKILRLIYKIDNQDEKLIQEILKYFDKGAKNTVTLIPQIIFQKGIKYAANGQNMNKFGEVNQTELLNLCQASERFFRKQISDKQLNITRKIMELEGKSKDEIQTEIKQRAKQSLTASTTRGLNSARQQESSSFSSLFSGFFGQSFIDDTQVGNKEQIEKLNAEHDQLNKEKVELMTIMNQMYAHLINNNSLQTHSEAKFEENSSDQFIFGQINHLLVKILQVYKENLSQIIGTQDGLYCMLFLRNCLRFLTQLNNQKDQNIIQALDLIWQEMHIIASSLTKTCRKVSMLGKSRSQSSSFIEDDSSSFKDDTDLNLSNLDILESPLQISSTNSESQQRQSFVSFSNQGRGRNEKRVYQSFCRHLILDIYFEINKHQLSQIASSQKGDPQESNQTQDVQECMREVQRVFKSIFQSSLESSSDNECHESKIFDDLHVIIGANNLLSLPHIQYDKMDKFLRNLVIYSTQTSEYIQIEVFAQKFEAFTEVIKISNKFIKGKFE